MLSLCLCHCAVHPDTSGDADGVGVLSPILPPPPPGMRLFSQITWWCVSVCGVVCSLLPCPCGKIKAQSVRVQPSGAEEGLGQ